MKFLYPRQKQQYLFASLLGALALINLLFFLILYGPARSEYYRLQDSIRTFRAESASRTRTLERLEKLSAQLETSEQDRNQLVKMHFIPRADGFSKILPELDGLVRGAGLQKTRVDYEIDDAPQYGLYSVKMKLPLIGGYSDVIDFIRELEKSDTFFIIDSIDVRNTSSTNSPDIALTLGVETFFYK